MPERSDLKRETRKNPATGVLTFLIADIREYTPFTLQRGDEAAATLSTKFAELAQPIVEEHSGEVIELRGDEALAVFTSARQALRAAVELQERFKLEIEREPSLPLKVGIGLDSGEAVPVDGGYRGAALNLAARLSALAGPGEVLTSEGVVHLARKVEGLGYVDRGMVQLKGFADSLRVLQVFREPSRSAESTDIGNGMEASASAAPERPLPIGGFLGALPAGPLVARERELAQVLSRVDAVTGGSGRLIILTGEPGIGKTRLAQEVALEVRNRGFAVASGRCYKPYQGVPFYPFLEALATVYASADAGLRTQVQRDWPNLGHLLPHQLRAPSTPTAEAQDEHHRLLQAVTSLVVSVAERTPLAIFLDDLHWADNASLELLQHLARHTRAFPVLLLGTHRDTEVQGRDALAQALRDLNREQLSELVKVAPLDQHGTAGLMAAALNEPEISTEFAALVHRQTEGNPFFTQEVVRALVDRGDVFREKGKWGRRDLTVIEVPDSVRSAIEERLSHLSVGARDVLRAGSVLGQSFDFDDLLAVVAGVGTRATIAPDNELGAASTPSETEVEAGLEEARAAGLIREVDRNGYAINHALTQHTLYAELPSRRRRRLHLAVGEALERLPEQIRALRAGELAWHFLEGGDDQRALHYSMLAGDQAELVFAHTEAEQLYRTALHLLQKVEKSAEIRGQPSPRLGEAEALRKLGGALKNLACYDEALQVLEKAADIYAAAGDTEAQLRTITQIGFIHHVQGTNPREGIARIEQLLELLQDRLPDRSPSQAEAEVHIPLAHLLMRDGNYIESLRAAERAGELARAVDDDHILVAAEGTRGDALRLLGHPQDALQVLEQTISLAKRVGDHGALFLALDAVAEMHLQAGEFQRCRQRQEEVLQLVERLGDPAKISFELIRLGNVDFYLGRWSEARQHLQRALDLARSLGSTWVTGPSLFGLAMLDVAEGHWDEARRYLIEGIDMCEQVKSSYHLATGHTLLADLDLRSGEVEAARSRLELLLGNPAQPETQVSSLLPLLGWAYLELGQDDQAETIIIRALQLATDQQNRLALLEAMRVQGMILGRQGRRQESATAFEAGLFRARSMPFPYGEARILFEYGVMSAHAIGREEARSYLQRAGTIFGRLGASRDAQRAEEALAACARA